LKFSLVLFSLVSSHGRKLPTKKILALNIKTLKIGKGYLKDEKKITFFSDLYVTG